MSEYINDLIFAVKEIQKKEWHNATRKGSTAIGKTFEDLLDKEEDNNDLPDFYDIEIKTHETAINSMLTMFTKSPTYPKGANTMLRNEYGIKDEYNNNILHTTVSGNRKTKSEKYDYNYQIKVDRKKEIVKLNIYNKEDFLINDSVFWSFEDLQNQINKKLNTIAIISAESRMNDGTKQYKYKEVDIVTGLSVWSLVDGIENGDVKVDIRIGAYKTGKNKGKTHDHGTAFRIELKNLIKYASVNRVIK
ncbi:glycosyl hydrolase [Staphylococcus cohnii]|uniref:MvaI/BcnI family restriction endonuclease n=1 Tax=Staphylococcus cohnii TaxID=29382 RepID=UPI000D1CB2FA|nr:MvaI/BcnI family restriction endonuclease [Staphylococcus cohnii]PTF24738.1 glycosyl hydrolase [Staphylococcus cohnii]